MKITWNRDAVDELKHALEQTRTHWPSSLPLFVRTLSDSLQMIRSFPQSGAPWEPEGTRMLILGRFPYLLIYYVRDAELTIMRIFHSAQQWASEDVSVLSPRKPR